MYQKKKEYDYRHDSVGLTVKLDCASCNDSGASIVMTHIHVRNRYIHGRPFYFLARFTFRHGSVVQNNKNKCNF